MSAARPPEGAHTAAEGEGAPVSAARPPEGAHTAAEGEGAPVSANHPTPVLDIRALTVEFPVYQGAVRALDGVQLQVQAGEIVGVVGESGCGKSVTAMLTMQLLPKGSYRMIGGSISLLGQDMLGACAASLQKLRGSRVAMVFQEPLTALNPTRRIGAQMTQVIRRHQRLDRAAARTHAQQLLADMRVADPADILARYPFELSGGMRQRVLIALAFSGDPALIIADEPTTALDVTVQQQVLTLLRQRARRSHTAVLLITHDMGVISQYTDRSYVMYAGRVIESGDTASVLSQPAHPYTAALLQALPQHGTRKTRLPALAGSVPDLRAPPAGCSFAARCPQAFARCASKPPLSPVPGNPARQVACWLHTAPDRAA
ncbi:ABC transporter ATP-binding protein [Verminephrobacter eiseniae]|uniref:ABC transporter ATP-binding protein n=1 Tax=Verminephrobacter eiseniae TaxID=364317 RepID=UPI0022375CEA|nr:ABC transporter ATP-binding protein [Verminephrobacter eiseniae]